MQFRVEFAKLSPVRYISHLELMSTLRRAFRRAGIPVAYSQGFNPHQLLSMGQPLSVGMTGKAEYFDLGLAEEMDPAQFVQAANEKMPVGLVIGKAREVPDNIKSLMAVADTAIYSIRMEFNKHLPEEREKEIAEEFFQREEIMIIRRRRKKDDKPLDLKPLIYELEVTEPGRWEFTVSTGSRGNVRPEELVRAVTKYYPEVNQVPLINIEREGLFVRGDNRLYKPIHDKVVGS